MAPKAEKTVSQYLSELPPDRRKAIAAVRKAIREKLPKGYKEAMQYGMISYIIPLSRYPDTYNGHPLTVASLGSQKSHMAVYLMCVYGSTDLGAWFRRRYAESGKKLDMGKACVRFKKLEDLPVELIAETVEKVTPEKFIEVYEKARTGTRGGR